MTEIKNPAEVTSLPPSLTSASSLKDDENSKLLLLDFRSGESVSQHPSVAPLLEDGWHLERATPRVVEDEGCKLFVVLSRFERSAPTAF